MRILAIGEILWDVFDRAETLGGAPLNFSAAMQRLGDQVALITGVGDDLRGQRAIEAMTVLGLSKDFVQVIPRIATGTAEVTTDDGGNARYLIRRPAAFDEFQLSDSQMSAIEALHADWLYFGTLAQTNTAIERMLGQILGHIQPAKCFYDMNLRDGHWNLPLVKRLSGLASIAKLNETEAETLFHLTNRDDPFSLERFCRYWSSTYEIETICVTLGGEGCAIFKENSFHRFSGFVVKVADTVGAGDAFAAAFLHGYGLSWPTAQTARFANALGALVASREGATPTWTVDQCKGLLAEAGDAEAESNTQPI